MLSIDELKIKYKHFPRKIFDVIEIYRELEPKREGLSKRQFRALVVEQMIARLGITNKGTIGSYYAGADLACNDREIKTYNVTTPRRNKKEVERAIVASPEQEEKLNRLADQVLAKAAKKAKVTPFSDMVSQTGGLIGRF